MHQDKMHAICIWVKCIKMFILQKDTFKKNPFLFLKLQVNVAVGTEQSTECEHMEN